MSGEGLRHGNLVDIEDWIGPERDALRPPDAEKCPATTENPTGILFEGQRPGVVA